MILVKLGSNDQLLIETLGFEAIFAVLRHILSQCTKLYQNQAFPANRSRNQAVSPFEKNHEISLSQVKFRTDKIFSKINEKKYYYIKFVHNREPESKQMLDP